MSTTVTYSVVPRTNLAELGKPPLFYAMAQAKGTVDVNTLSNRINSMCTVHPADVFAVLTALESAMAACLMNGEIVRLGQFGSFQVGISSAGAKTREEFSTNLIYGAHYLFRPGFILSAALKIIKYEQVPVRLKKHNKVRQSTVFEDLNPIPI